jgi:hypothetical protein
VFLPVRNFCHVNDSDGARRNDQRRHPPRVRPGTVDRARKPRTIEWKKQFDKAIEAFESNGIVILVDDKQVESLDEEIVIQPETRVSFLRLTMLVGG